MRFLALVLGWWIYKPFSVLIAAVLRAKGIRVGRNFYIQGVPYVKARGLARNIVIGDNVRVFGDIDLRNRENGKILIKDSVTFDTGCRLVAANDASLVFEQGADIGGYCIFNCGTDVTIGKDALIGGGCLIQSSNHGIRRSLPIKQQPHTYGTVVIGANSWIGAQVSVLAGVEIGEGAVVGGNAVVTRGITPYAIAAGVPAREIGKRSD